MDKPLRCTARLFTHVKNLGLPAYKICNKIAKWQLFGGYRCGRCANTTLGRAARKPLPKEANVKEK